MLRRLAAIRMTKANAIAASRHWTRKREDHMKATHANAASALKISKGRCRAAISGERYALLAILAISKSAIINSPGRMKRLDQFSLHTRSCKSLRNET